MGLRIEYIQIIQHTTYSLIFAKASANALLIGCSASFCCFFKYRFTSFLLIPEPCFSFLCLKQTVFPYILQNCIQTSVLHLLLTFPFSLWHTGHLAFVILEIVFLYPQVRSWHTRRFPCFPLTSNKNFPHSGQRCLVTLSCLNFPSDVLISLINACV